VIGFGMGLVVDLTLRSTKIVWKERYRMTQLTPVFQGPDRGLNIVFTGNGKGKTTAAMTGRLAPAQRIDFADLVTEMREIKHLFRQQGLPAQAGVDY
jgi:ATP:corrinoid adenosyltransferase